MEDIGLNGMIIIGGVSGLALIAARYSVDVIFNTMQYFISRLGDQKRK